MNKQTHLLLKDKTGREFVVKRADISRVSQNIGKPEESCVRFTGKANGSIIIKKTPGEFFKEYLQ